MDRQQEAKAQAEKAYFAEQERLGGLRAGVGAAETPPTAFGLAQDECIAKTYSPRLGLMSRLDHLTDDLLSQVSRLREFRKSVEQGTDYDARRIEEAIQILQPR